MSALRCFDSASPWDRTRLQACIDHGAIAASFYVRGTPGGFRHASKADVTLARSMGLGAVPNGEWTAEFFNGCSLAEARAAGVEVREAAQACGFPDDGTITLPVSFDYQVPASGLKAAVGKLHAVQDGCGPAYRISLYGQSSLIAYAAHNGFGDRGHWLMGSTWQNTSTIEQPSTVYDIGSRFVAMVQSHDAAGQWLNSPVQGTDINTVTRPELLGAWWPEGSEYDMPSAQEIAAAVWAQLLPAADGTKYSAAVNLKMARQAAQAAADPKKLAAAVVAAMPAGSAANEAEIEAALRKVFADAGAAQ